MASASIIISQPANPQPVGIAGRARDDILAATPVTLSNSNDDGVTSWRWALLDIPTGSSAVLTTTFTPATSFTPDVAGTYRISLGVNSAAPGEEQVRIAIVRDEFSRRIPAAGELGPEANYDISGSPNPKGWGPDAQQMLGAIINYTFANATGSDFTAAVSASEVITKLGLGLPAVNGDLVAHDFFQIMGAGPVPTINTTSVLTLPAPTYNLIGISYDLDTSASTIGDRFVIVSTTQNPGGRFVVGTLEIV